MSRRPRIGFLGAGNMAEALIHGILRAGVTSPEAVLAHDPVADQLAAVARRHKIRRAPSNAAVVRGSDWIVLAVKPKDVSQALREASGALARRHLVVSIAAGVRVRTLRAAVGHPVRIVRVMPNTPALVGQGAAGVYRGTGSRADVQRVLRLMESVGLAVEVPDERSMDAVTALSGSGPGFAFRIFEAFVKGGRALGFRETQARSLTLQTFLGAARLASVSKEPLEALRKKVTSPGGTTEAGLRRLSRGVDPLVTETLKAAYRRSRQMGRDEEPVRVTPKSSNSRS